ncbi:B-cell linker protein isoform X2 [Betta splendens]|uniref:B-cell linker protein isoform X2 n=1 Tax=Betta splendens TaxID=158456 RepID=A0A6P7KRJ4_BETSP|nr:B-cell linker protein isoform X2 [Betta splendens]
MICGHTPFLIYTCVNYVAAAMQTLGLNVNMDTFGKLTAPATAKIRQLQKMVQDIKKNDGSFLDKLKRLKSKPVPKVPARDYRDNSRESDEQSSDPDYNNDTYEDPHDDDSYEPPPPHRVLPTAPLTAFPKGEYLDSCRNGPSRPPRKPLRPPKGSKQLPPEPTQAETDEGDYINPDDDNYIEPEENPPASQDGSGAGNRRPSVTPAIPERSPSPDCYEVPDKEVRRHTHNKHPVMRHVEFACLRETTHTLIHENSLRLPSRLTTKSHAFRPKPSPRLNVRQLPSEPTGEDEYEVCDQSSSSDVPDDRPPLLPRPLLRERSPKPPSRLRPEVKPREFESRTLPASHANHKPPTKTFTLDVKRPKVPLPHITTPKPTDGASVSDESGSTDQDKNTDFHKKPWFANGCDRKTADDALFRLNKDGAFMVRRSSGQDAQQPYTLVVFYKGRVYNIPIRFIPATKQYALGREKRGEEFFSSICHIIENHQRNPLVLIDSQSNTKDATKLCHPTKP